MQTSLPNHSVTTTAAPAHLCNERVIERSISELRPHPAIARHQIQPSVQKLSRLSANPERAFREPLTITRSGIILDGHARWWLARQCGREMLPCLERDLTEEEALLHLLSSQRRSEVLNDFTRIVLALELEPWLQEQARSNRRIGGQLKGSSNLTEAARIDVRSRLASAAGVSVGNISKTKELLKNAHPELVSILRDDEVSIHQAWRWCRDFGDGLEALRVSQTRSGIRTQIQTLADRHRFRKDPSVIGLRQLRSAFNVLLKDPRVACLSVDCEILIDKLVGQLGEVQHARS